MDKISEQILLENEQMYSATMVLDSYNTDAQCRLSTMHLVLPWMLTPELLRHRNMSFSSRSTRATPAKRMMSQVRNKPCLPVHWGVNQPGMQANEQVEDGFIEDGIRCVQNLAGVTADIVQYMSERLFLHKQVVNKYFIPYLWCDILVSATTWANFLALRTHEFADPGMQIIARLMADALVESTPQPLNVYEWHTPYVDQVKCNYETGWTVDDFGPQNASAARCARLSIRNFDDDKEDWDKDIVTARKLQISKPVHASPFEHVAQAMPKDHKAEIWELSNFAPAFRQYRKMLPNNTETAFIWKGQVIR